MAKSRTLSFLYDREEDDMNTDAMKENKKKENNTEKQKQNTDSKAVPDKQIASEKENIQESKMVEEKNPLPNEREALDIAMTEKFSSTDSDKKETAVLNTEETNNEEKASSFLKKKISDDTTVKMNIYLPKEYMKMNELAAKVYEFSNKSDFVRKLFVTIIDNEEIPNLKELYLMALEKTTPSKQTKSVKSKHKFLERFLPEEKRKMQLECYMVYERHQKILVELAEEHDTTASKIVCNMYDAMVN